MTTANTAKRTKTDGAVFKGGYLTGNDAAYIEPKLIPDYELQPRDDSGGPEWEPYTAAFGDGGYVTGDKAHLSARGGEDDQMGDSNEQSQRYRNSGSKGVAMGKSNVHPKVPSTSKSMQKE